MVNCGPHDNFRDCLNGLAIPDSRLALSRRIQDSCAHQLVCTCKSGYSRSSSGSKVITFAQKPRSPVETEEVVLPNAVHVNADGMVFAMGTKDRP